MGVTGAHVEVCRDRACTQVEEALDVEGTSVRPTQELSPRVHFWRAFARIGGQTQTAASFTWEFRAPHQSAPSDLSTGAFVDVNGDGFGDVVWQDHTSEHRSTYVYPGSSQGLPSAPSQRIWNGEPTNLGLVGDVNGDGFVDVAIIDSVGGLRLNRATVDVHFGSERGLSTDYARVQGPDIGYDFGLWVTTLGDLDADGYGDFGIISSGLLWNPTAEIKFYIVRGSAAGPSRQLIQFRSPEIPGEYISGFREMGDMNGDGVADLLVGTGDLFGQGEGHGLLYTATVTGIGRRPLVSLRTPSQRLIVPADNRMTPSPCDVNLDGLSDLATYSHRRGETPRLQVFLGRRSTSDWTPDFTSNLGGTTDPQMDAVMGVSCGGDYDGDGYSDMVIGGLGLWWMSGGRQFSPRWRRIGIGDTPGGFHDYSGNDLDGDGFADIIMFTESSIQLIRGHTGEGPVGIDQVRPRPDAPHSSMNLGRAIF